MAERTSGTKVRRVSCESVPTTRSAVLCWLGPCLAWRSVAAERLGQFQNVLALRAPLAGARTSATASVSGRDFCYRLQHSNARATHVFPSHGAAACVAVQVHDHVQAGHEHALLWRARAHVHPAPRRVRRDLYALHAPAANVRAVEEVGLAARALEVLTPHRDGSLSDAALLGRRGHPDPAKARRPTLEMISSVQDRCARHLAQRKTLGLSRKTSNTRPMVSSTPLQSVA